MSKAGPVFADRSRCVHCRTELAPHSLACPACGTLVYADQLKQAAASATEATKAGELVRARERWEEAMRFLPSDSRQYATIQSRVTELSKQIEAASPAESKPKTDASWWKRGGAAIVTVGLLFIGKLKFLVLGLTKASTFFSMFAFFGVYWSLYGWPLAAGLAISIYIHEMGHVAMLRRLGIAAGAPLFIPGFGAMVMLKQHVTD